MHIKSINLYRKLWRVNGLRMLLSIFFTAITVSHVCAQTNTWTGATDNDWHKPCNWSLNTVPTCSDSVVIPSASVYPVVTDTAQARVISVTSPDPNTLTINYTGGGIMYVSSTNGGTCIGNPAVHQLTAPVIGTITQPTCNVSTGSVALSGLPATGTWTITGTPSGNLTGTGTTATISGLTAGTNYTFTVSVGACSSAASSGATINSSGGSLSAPVVGTITQPTCSVATGSVDLSGLPSSGSWTVTGSPSGTLSGSGTTGTVTGLTAGTTYTFTVTQGSCTSSSSGNAVVNAQPVGTSGSQTFNYTGGVQHFTVSSNECATTLSIDIRGAQGGSSLHNTSSTVSRSVGGSGGRVECTSCITVTPGQVIDVYVGGKGGDATATWPNTVVKGTAGYNGGGTGGAIGIYFGGGGGGGASDIRTSGGSVATRLAVAGGGGGAGIYVGGTNTDEGGVGGGTTGGTGYAGNSQTMIECGKGGTQAAGGTPGNDGAGYGGCAAAYGALGTGGRACEMTGNADSPCPVGGGSVCQDDPAGGGGGGYYGGGAASNAGGGGGSSYPASATHTQGYQTGNGQIIISWP